MLTKQLFLLICRASEIIQKNLKPSLLETRELYNRLKENDELGEKKRNEIKTEIQKRHSFAVACFAFGLLAIPLGISKQRSDSQGGYVVSLIIACIYFLGIIYADNLKDLSSAQYLMWLPTLIITIVGMVCLSGLIGSDLTQ